MPTPIPLIKPEPLRALAERFARRKVLVVGDLVADHYVYGQTERVSREAPVLVVRHESEEVKLGGGANVVANLHSMGGQATVVGAIGQDLMGRELKRLLKQSGARFLGVASPELSTESKTRILAGGIHTTRQQMLRLDRGGSSQLSMSVALELCALIREAAGAADAVVVSDYGSGLFGDQVRKTLSDLCADGMTVLVDSRYRLASFSKVTLAKPNEPELAALTGLPIASDRDLLEAGRRAVKVLQCKSLLVTRGRNGMALFDGRGQGVLIAVHGADEAVDPTGAGDTVLAAMALALAAGGSTFDAAQIANIAGAQVVQKMGTATVSHAELLGELASKVG